MTAQDSRSVKPKMEFLGLDVICLADESVTKDGSDISVGSYDVESFSCSTRTCEEGDYEVSSVELPDSIMLARTRGLPIAHRLRYAREESTRSNSSEDSQRVQRRNVDESNISRTVQQKTETFWVALKDMSMKATPAPDVRCMRRQSIGNTAA